MEHLSKFLKEHKLSIHLDSSSAAEVASTFIKAFSEFVELFNSNNAGVGAMFDIILEVILREQFSTSIKFTLLTEKLSDIYGVKLDWEHLSKEAEEFLEKHWPEMKEKYYEQIRLQQKIDEIFKDKPKG
jgi:hypothetical protein